MAALLRFKDTTIRRGGWYNKIMKVVSIIAALVLATALLGGVVYFLWPSVFSFWSKVPAVVGGFTVALYETSNPSVLVQNAKIVPREHYTLAFPFSGRIASVLATEGQLVVNQGLALVQMERTEWELAMKKTEAVYNENQALVKKLQQGARFEELLILEQKKQSATSTLKGSKKELIDAITTAFVRSDDAVRNKTDVIFTNPSTNPVLSFTPSDAALKTTLESERGDMEDTLDDWRDDVDGMKVTGNVSRYVEQANKKLDSVREYLDLVALAVNELTAGAIDQDTIDAWKDAVATAREAVVTAGVDLGSIESGYRVAGKEAHVAQSELDYRLAGTARQDVEAALSAAAAAKSEMDIVADKLKQTTLTTPLPGLLVKKIIPKPGEFVQAGEPVALLANPLLEAEIDIPEEKIAGVAVGNAVMVRLNAYAHHDIMGSIRTIEPQEVEKDGGMYFRVRASLEKTSKELRMGMLGDAIVATELQGNVVLIPKQAVRSTGDRRTVLVVVDDVPQERTIETGMENERSIEVLSGVQAGDRILIPDTPEEGE